MEKSIVMKELSLKNAFGSPVYYLKTVSSTMDVSRSLAEEGAPHGTVILSDFQEAGRGRIGRPWKADRGENLFFTILLRYTDYAAIPKALTLKTGLAISLAIEEFIRDLNLALRDSVRVKWPNDIMLGDQKAAGILTEGDGKRIYIGIGINVAQTQFPDFLQRKATSIALFSNFNDHTTALFPANRFMLLEKILAGLFREITAQEDHRWRIELLDRLYKQNHMVRFIPGPADSPGAVEGLLQGIGPLGELLIIPKGQTEAVSFITGELDVYGVS
jgi:BirA family biotin operon repressor/biotin-[acetyl-CoA-carboxylase] ligase